MEGRLVGWGDQGRTPEDLVAAMSDRGATRLVDVRLTPVSRVRGFSKSRLRDRLEAAGFVYEHRPELGNPKDNRPGYARPGTPAADAAHRRYLEDVACSERGAAAIDHLAALVDGGEIVFVLCFEHDQECCHRAQIIDAVDELRVKARFTRDLGTALALAG